MSDRIERIGDATLYQGDARAVLADLPEASVDAVVTDPPYELGFMGKGWDATGIANNLDLWRQVLRVLKPGGHLLAFGGSRTYHRMTCAIEDAGFEIRDCIMWVYGSGFPKSLDVSKAIDKARAEDMVPIRVLCRAVRAAMDSRGLKSPDLVEHFGGCHARLIDHWAARDSDSQPNLPTPEQWAGLRNLFPELAAHDAEAARLNARKGLHGDAWRDAPVLGVYEDEPPGFGPNMSPGQDRFRLRDKLIREPTETAQAWQGWGTALKPAHEPVVMARKPLAGTVAANVLAYGTGALNIDGCRVNTGAVELHERTANITAAAAMAGTSTGSTGTGQFIAGRWPANLLHDGSAEVVALFPDVGKAGQYVGQGRDPDANAGGYAGGWRKDVRDVGFADSGSAARFFYTAKASGEDRHEGIPGTSLAHGRNVHATVKPVDLMRYLCRLVTPPGGTVADVFMGSGSTGKAALLEGFRFIGVELLPDHFALACRRIEHAWRQGFQFGLLDDDGPSRTTAQA